MKKFLMTITAILIPFLFVGLIECVLQLSKYSKINQSRFITDPDDNSQWVFNPFYTDRYFSNFYPGVARNPFQKDKSLNTFRIFVLGGSTTAGFPYQYDGSFASKLETRLRLIAPGKTIEVINLGVTAFSTFAVLDLSKEIIQYKPDAIIMYSGHNEFFGALGSASSFNIPGISSSFLKRSLSSLWDFKLTWLIKNNLPKQPEVKRGGTIMAKAIQQSAIYKDDVLFNETIEQFYSNLEEITSVFKEHHIPVFVSTLVSNLKDQSPLGKSQLANNTFIEAKSALNQKLYSSSFQLFMTAKEHDPLRFRAPDTLNTIIRTHSQIWGYFQIPMDSVFNSLAQNHIPGNDLFTDHLHPNSYGYEIMAKTFATEIQSKFSIFNTLRKYNYKENINPLDESRAELRINLLKADIPFKSHFSEYERESEQQTIFTEHKKRSKLDSLAATMLDNNNQIEQNYQKAISLLATQNDTLGVLSTFRGWLVMSPFNEKEILNAALKYVGTNKKWFSLIEQLCLSTHAPYENPFTAQLLTSISILKQEFDITPFYLERIQQIEPHSPTTYFNAFRYYKAINDSLNMKLNYTFYQSSLNRN